VVTDLQAGGWDAGDHASVPESTRVEVQDVGALPDNLAVVGLRSEGDRVVVTVRNDSQRARDVAVRLSVDGRMAGERSAPVAPHGTADVVFSAVSGGEAAASVDDRDGLQADNVRYARLTGTSRSAVLVVTATGDLDRDAFYVHQALVAGGTARAGGASGVTGVAAGQLGSWTSAQTASFASVLLLSTRGLDRRGRELIASYVAAGGGLLIAVGQDVDGDVAAVVLGAAAKLRVQAPDDRRAPQPLSLAPADIRHPIFQPFGPAAASLGLVRFERVAAINASGCQTLAKFTSGEAAVIDCGIGEGHALVVSSDLNNRWNDFPLHASFLPFMHETVRYLSRGRAQATEYLVGEAPAGAVPVPGIVTLGAAGAPSRRVVINVDPVESEPARISPAEFESAIARLKDAGAAETRTAASNRESGQRVWQYLLGAMMVLLAVEGAVAARTV
jgi:hypothetical protein